VCRSNSHRGARRRACPSRARRHAPRSERRSREHCEGRETKPREGRASQGPRPEKRKRWGRYEEHRSDRLAWCLRDRTHDRTMEALDALAVAERDILARSTAPHNTRENRARAGDHGPSAREPVSPFQSARDQSVAPATEQSTPRQPVQPNLSWRTERARAGRGERSERSRLSDPYPRECGAVRLSERGYVAERPRAGRGLSTHTDECGCNHVSIHTERANRGSSRGQHSASRSSRSSNSERTHPASSSVGSSTPGAHSSNPLATPRKVTTRYTRRRRSNPAGSPPPTLR